jgi:hypothetical protein
VASSARTVKVRFDGDARGLARAAQSGERQMSRLQKSMGGVKNFAGGLGKSVGGIGKGFGIAGLAVAGLGGALIAGGKQVFGMAAQLELMGKKAKVVFGDQLPQVEGWASRTAHSMGLTNREAVGLAASFADLLIPMGFSRKEAAKMSTDVVGLSGALAEWSGGQKSAAEVSDILNAAMLGERDALQGLGISISQAEVDAVLLAKHQDKLTGKARQQAEAQATLGLVMAKSTDAQKAFANGAGSLARKNAENSARMKEMGQTLLVAVTPALLKIGDAIAKHVMPVLERFVNWVSGPGKYVIADWALSGSQMVLNFVDTMLSGLETILRMVGKWGKGFLRAMAITIAPFNATLAKSMWDAADKVGGFADSTLQSLAAARGGIKTAETAIAKAKLVAKLNADKSLLDQKLAAAKLQLTDPNLTAERRAKLNADIASLLTQKTKAQAAIDALHGKTVTVTIAAKLNAAQVRNKVLDQLDRELTGRASGGPVVAGRQYLVGERGPEILTMGGSSGRIMNAEQTAAALSADAQPIVVENHIEIGGEVVRVVRTEIKQNNRDLKRTVKAG